LLLGATDAEAASLKAVTAQEADSAVTGYRYRRLKVPEIGDQGDRVVFFGITKANPGFSGKPQGAFAHDPDGGGHTVGLKFDVTAESDLIRKVVDWDIDSEGNAVYIAKTSGGRGIYREGPSTVVLSSMPAAGLASGVLKEFEFVQSVFGSDTLGDPFGSEGLDLFGSDTTGNEAVVFLAKVPGGPVVDGVELDQGVYACAGGDLNCFAGTGTLSLLVTNNTPVSNVPGRELCGIRKLAASAYGVVVKGESKDDCTDNAEIGLLGLFRKAYNGPLEMLAILGGPAQPDPAPGGTTYSDLGKRFDMNDSGQVVFLARTAGVSSKRSLYLCDTACPATPAEQAVPMNMLAPNGDPISDLRAISTRISNAGEIAFWARTKGLNGRSTFILLRQTNGTLVTVAEEGGVAPKLDPADPIALFRRFDREISISPGGRVAFKAKIKRAYGPKRSRDAIFAYE